MNLVINASARSTGNSKLICDIISDYIEATNLDLKNYKVEHYNYESKYPDDDQFMYLVDNYLIPSSTFVFVTPVYWYNMSGYLKVFFDRITDLITAHKEKGRLLRGKRMIVISTSNGSNLGDDFWHCFKAIADYLDMDYLGNLHCLEGGNSKDILQFISEFY